MSLDTQLGNTAVNPQPNGAAVTNRTYPFNNPAVLAKARAKATAVREQFKREHPVLYARQVAARLAAMQAGRKKKAARRAAKKNAATFTPATAAPAATESTKETGTKRTLSISKSTWARFSAFRNGAVSVDAALNMLLDLAGNKKITAKVVATSYSVE